LVEGDEVRCGDFSMTYLVEEHTREVGDIAEEPKSKAAKPAPPPPRIVGSISQSKPPQFDAGVIERPTVGLQQPDEVPNFSPPPPRRKDDDGEDRVKGVEAELSAAQLKIEALNDEVSELRDSRDSLRKTSDEAREEIASLTKALDSARADQGNGAGSDDDLIDQLVEVYEDLDSFTSEVKLKLKLAQTFLADLGPVVELMQTLHGHKDLPKTIQSEIRDCLESAEAEETLTTAQSAFAEAERATRASRRMVRLLREALRPHIGK
jgi:hypothetical protein